MSTAILAEPEADFAITVKPMTSQTNSNPSNSSNLTTRKLTLLHLSDLHFGQGDAQVRFNQKIVVGQILSDVKKMVETLKPPDWIVITGDIAFSAHKKEYAEARKWIAELLKVAGCDESRVLMVPENHDVDPQSGSVEDQFEKTA